MHRPVPDAPASSGDAPASLLVYQPGCPAKHNGSSAFPLNLLWVRPQLRRASEPRGMLRPGPAGTLAAAAVEWRHAGDKQKESAYVPWRISRNARPAGDRRRGCGGRAGRRSGDCLRGHLSQPGGRDRRLIDELDVGSDVVDRLAEELDVIGHVAGPAGGVAICRPADWPLQAHGQPRLGRRAPERVCQRLLRLAEPATEDGRKGESRRDTPRRPAGPSLSPDCRPTLDLGGLPAGR